MLRSGLTICCLLYLAGCRTAGELRRTPADGIGPASPADAAMLSNATTYLRERLNAGSCDLIYSEASDDFRLRISGNDWRRACHQLRSEFGLWEGSIVRSTTVWQSDLATVDGSAAFSGGPDRFMVYWRLQNRGARLLALSLGSNERQVLIPKPPAFPGLIDPPPPRNPVSKPPDGEPA
jgi:hypothetical protein